MSIWPNRNIVIGICALVSVLVVGCDQNSDASTSEAPPAVAQPPTTTQPQTAAQPQASPVVAQPRGAQQASPAVRAASNPAALVYEQHAQSVVNITSTAVARTPLGPSEQEGVGSGFVIDQQGHIVTNNHVVQDANQLSVTFKDGATVPATLVGRDPDNDLAVIRVDPSVTTAAGNRVSDLLRPVQLGAMENVVVGETAIAIGSPLGLQQTVTEGIVSAVRSPLEDTGQGQVELLGGAIQTDAAVNPGNSGGPLFNATGEVIGVNSAILSRTGGNIGIGFAIPVDVVRRVVPELIQHGCYRHPYIGVSTISLSRLGQQVKEQLGIPTNQKGLLVQEVSAGAAQAGLQAGQQAVPLQGTQLRTGGDIIVAVDGIPVTTGGDLRGYIENRKRPGESVTLTVLRNGQQQQIQVPLSVRPGGEACRQTSG